MEKNMEASIVCGGIYIGIMENGNYCSIQGYVLG